MSVFHSRGEDTEIVNFKKGIAAAFQANFKGSEEEIETDPQSSHMAHYRLEYTAMHYLGGIHVRKRRRTCLVVVDL